MPHGHCYLWQPEVLWSNVIGDGLTSLAYFAIPLALGVFVYQRPDLRYRRIFWLFSLFILACGTTHTIDIVTVWNPTYRIEGIVKLLTGVVSVITAIYLWTLIPVAIRVPSLKVWDQTRQELMVSNQDLKEKIQELEKARQEMESFAYTLSHNMRGPIRQLISFSENLQEDLDDGRLTPREQEDISAINQASRNMGALIDDLLDYMKTGSSELELARIDLDTIIRNVVRVINKISSPKINWTIDPLPTIYGDHLLHTQLWQNLLENAAKFSARQNPAEIRLAVSREEQFWIFTLEDNGVGFPEAGADKMFEMFQRLHKRSEFPGTGIGLAQVKQIVERHGGSIQAENRTDSPGARFILRLPIEPNGLTESPAT